MAKQGLLDKRLANIQEFPFCPGCQFGKQTRRAWRHRSNKKLRRRRLRKARKPGDVVSVDTMNSVSVPGLVPNPVLNNWQNPSMSGSSTTIATTEFLLIRPTKPHVKLAIKASVSVVSMRIIKAVLPRNDFATFKILHGPCF